jgi:hypothetical protein
LNVHSSLAPLTRAFPWLALPLLVLACSGGRAPVRDEQQHARGDPRVIAEVSPGVVFPTTLGEGHGDGDGPALPPESSASPSPSASSSAAAAEPSATSVRPPSSPPDPEPLRLADQWEYQLESKAGKVTVVAVQPRHFKSPVVTARRFGRFAIELWIGPELVERVRFDFPGLALEEPEQLGARRPLYRKPDLGRGADVRQKVLVPASPRARRALLIDRASGEASPLPWPPPAMD